MYVKQYNYPLDKPIIVKEEKSKSGFYVIKDGNHRYQQALELGVIPFYILYVLEWILKLPIYGSKAYYNISFEREAYDNDDDLMYLEIRRRYNWIKRILK